MKRMSPKMMKAYSKYEKAESPREKMMEANKGTKMVKKAVRKATKRTAKKVSKK